MELIIFKNPYELCKVFLENFKLNFQAIFKLMLSSLEDFFFFKPITWITWVQK